MFNVEKKNYRTHGFLSLTKSCSSSVTENTNLNKNKLKSGTQKTNPIRWEALIMTASLS